MVWDEEKERQKKQWDTGISDEMISGFTKIAEQMKLGASPTASVIESEDEQQKRYQQFGITEEMLAPLRQPPESWRPVQMSKFDDQGASFAELAPRLERLAEKTARQFEPPVERSMLGEVGASLGRGALGLAKLPFEVGQIVGGRILDSETVRKAMEPVLFGLESAAESRALRPSTSAIKPIELHRLFEDPDTVVEQIKANVTNPRYWAAQLPEAALSMAGFFAGSIGARAAATAMKYGQAIKAIQASQALSKAEKLEKLAEIGRKLDRIARMGGYGASMAMEAGEAEARIREWEDTHGRLNWAKVVPTILLAGGLAGGLEAFSTERIFFGRHGAPSVHDLIQRLFEGKGGTILARKILDSVVTEGSTEGAQELVQNLAEKMGYNPNKELTEGIVDAVLIGGMLGGLAGTGHVSAAVIQQHKARLQNLKEKAAQERLASAPEQVSTPPETVIPPPETVIPEDQTRRVVEEERLSSLPDRSPIYRTGPTPMAGSMTPLAMPTGVVEGITPTSQISPPSTDLPLHQYIPQLIDYVDKTGDPVAARQLQDWIQSGRPEVLSAFQTAPPLPPAIRPMMETSLGEVTPQMVPARLAKSMEAWQHLPKLIDYVEATKDPIATNNLRDAILASKDEILKAFQVKPENQMVVQPLRDRLEALYRQVDENGDPLAARLLHALIMDNWHTLASMKSVDQAVDRPLEASSSAIQDVAQEKVGTAAPLSPVEPVVIRQPSVQPAGLSADLGIAPDTTPAAPTPGFIPPPIPSVTAPMSPVEQAGLAGPVGEVPVTEGPAPTTVATTPAMEAVPVSPEVPMTIAGGVVPFGAPGEGIAGGATGSRGPKVLRFKGMEYTTVMPALNSPEGQALKDQYGLAQLQYSQIKDTVDAIERRMDKDPRFTLREIGISGKDYAKMKDAINLYDKLKKLYNTMVAEHILETSNDDLQKAAVFYALSNNINAYKEFAKEVRNEVEKYKDLDNYTKVGIELNAIRQFAKDPTQDIRQIIHDYVQEALGAAQQEKGGIAAEPSLAALPAESERQVVSEGPSEAPTEEEVGETSYAMPSKPAEGRSRALKQVKKEGVTQKPVGKIELFGEANKVHLLTPVDDWSQLTQVPFKAHQVWTGNTAANDAAYYASDHIVIAKSMAVDKAIAKKYLTKERPAKYIHKFADNAAVSPLIQFVRENNYVPLSMVATYVDSLTPHHERGHALIYMVPSQDANRLIAVDAGELALAYRATAFDEVRGFEPYLPLALYRDQKLVGFVQPVIMVEPWSVVMALGIESVTRWHEQWAKTSTRYVARFNVAGNIKSMPMISKHPFLAYAEDDITGNYSYYLHNFGNVGAKAYTLLKNNHLLDEPAIIKFAALLMLGNEFKKHAPQYFSRGSLKENKSKANQLLQSLHSVGKYKYSYSPLSHFDRILVGVEAYAMIHGGRRVLDEKDWGNINEIMHMPLDDIREVMLGADGMGLVETEWVKDLKNVYLSPIYQDLGSLTLPGVMRVPVEWVSDKTRSQLFDEEIVSKVWLEGEEVESAPPTKLVATRRAPKETFDVSKIEHYSLHEAIERGLISAEEAAYIDGIMSTWPEAYREHFEVRISPQEFAATQEMKIRAGMPVQGEAAVAGVLIPEKVGQLKEDAKHLAVIFKHGDVMTFVHEFAEFAYDRLLTRDDLRVVNALFKEDKAKRSDMKKGEWFAQKFEEWWIRRGQEERGPIDSKLVALFRKILASIKAIYKRIRGAVKIDPKLSAIFEDIITGKRDINEKYYFTDEEMVARYVTGWLPGMNEKYLREADNQGFSRNSKTGYSWDPSSMCPKKKNFVDYMLEKGKEYGLELKDLADPEVLGNLYELAKRDNVDVPCSYCYVEQTRMMALAMHQKGFSMRDVLAAKAKVVYYTTQYVDKILRLSDKDIEDLNRRGGLRLFSFSDYIRELHYDEVNRLLDHAAARGLSIKAITKQPAFIEDFGHRGILINISIDKSGHGMDWDLAAKFKKQYPNVKIRAVATNPDEVLYYAHLSHGGIEKFVDVITPYHHESPEPIPPDYVDMSHGWGLKRLRQIVHDEDIGDRVCCLLGACFHEGKGKQHAAQCATNCGGKAGKLFVPRLSLESTAYRIYGRTVPTIQEPSEEPEVLTREVIQKAFPGAEVEPSGVLSGWDVKLPNGYTIIVLPNQEIRIPDYDSLVKAGYEEEQIQEIIANPERYMVAGAFVTIDDAAIILLSKGLKSQEAQVTLRHEIFHAASTLVLTEKEQELILEEFGDWENAARAYEVWDPEKKKHTIFQKIYEFFRRLYELFRPSWESVFRKVASGEVWTRPVNVADVEPSYSIREKKEAQETIDTYRDTYVVVNTDKGIVQKIREGMANLPKVFDELYSSIVNRWAAWEKLAQKTGAELAAKGVIIPKGEDVVNTLSFLRGIENRIKEGIVGDHVYWDPMEFDPVTEEMVFSGDEQQIAGPSLNKRLDALREFAKKTDRTFGEVASDLFHVFMPAQRDLELAGEFGNREAGEIEGVHPEQSRAALLALRTKYGEDGYNVLAKVADDIRDWADAMILKPLLRVGMLSADRYDRIKAKNQFYVPFRRLMDDLDDYIAAHAGGAGVKGNVIREIKGSHRKILDPLEMLLDMAYKAQYAYGRNRVIRGLYVLAKYAEMDDIYEVPAKFYPVPEKLKQEIDSVLRPQLEALAKSLGYDVKMLKSLGRNALEKLRVYVARSPVSGEDEVHREILVRFGTSEKTLSHALGHALDERYRLVERLIIKGTPEMRKELRAIADQRLPETASDYLFKYVRRRSEQVAEFINRYITDRERCWVTAPHTTLAFENWLHETPELKPLLDFQPTAQRHLRQFETELWARSPFPPEVGTLPYYRDGVLRWLKVPPEIYNAAVNLMPSELGILMRVAKLPADLLRAGAVLTPEFAGRNFVRDVVQAWLFSDFGFNPLKWFRDVWKVITKDADTIRLRKQWEAGGGALSTLAESFYVPGKITVERILNPEKVKYLPHPLQAMRYAAAFLENMTRFSVYKQAREAGMSHADAITRARRTTLDFSIVGAHPAMRYLSMIIPFFQPAILGVDKLVTELTGPNRKRVWFRLAMMTTVSILLYLLASKDDRYKELEPWERNYFWHIPLGDNMPLLRIPKPFEAGIMFGSLPVAMLDWALNGDFKEVKKALESAWAVVTPEIVPTLARPIVEFQANYDYFRGRAIEDEGLKKLPVAMRYKPWTTELAKAWGRHFGETTGISPVMMEHFIRTLAGGLGGNYLLPGIDVLMRKMGLLEDIPQPAQEAMQQVFGVRAFFSRNPIGYRAKSVNEFFENYQKVVQPEAQWKMMLKNNMLDEADKELRSHPEIMLARAARSIMTRMGNLRKEREKVYYDKGLTPDQKREKLDQIDEQLLRIAQQAREFLDPAIAKRVGLPKQQLKGKITDQDIDLYSHLLMQPANNVYKKLETRWSLVDRMKKEEREEYLARAIKQERQAVMDEVTRRRENILKRQESRSQGRRSSIFEGKSIFDKPGIFEVGRMP